MRHIAITMGCPVGVGPEIILKFFSRFSATGDRPVVLGDLAVLRRCADELAIEARLTPWQPGSLVQDGAIPVFELSRLPVHGLVWGSPTLATGMAMGRYIEQAVRLIGDGVFSAMVTCPISKASLNQAGYPYPGHTEMLAAFTGSTRYGMMMAGSRLRVTLATIHCPLSLVPASLRRADIADLIVMTDAALRRDFRIPHPRIAVAALNPHAGEGGLFGSEEETIIAPAIEDARRQGIQAQGPFPPDTIFHKAAEGLYDVVVCMYHDQGLIPFKLLHFKDGVNVTLGLPMVRTSVDHGVAYDIAGKGIADPSSLAAAVDLAALIAANRMKRDDEIP